LCLTLGVHTRERVYPFFWSLYACVLHEKNFAFLTRAYISFIFRLLFKTSAKIIHMSKDINELLNSIVSSTGKWYENVSTEVQEFLDAIEELIINNKQVNAVKISDILDAEYGLSITPTSVRTWLKELKKK